MDNFFKEFNLDVSEGTAGTVYTLKDLKISDKVIIDDDLSSVIGSIVADEREDDTESEEQIIIQIKARNSQSKKLKLL